MDAPELTILVPVYNERESLGRALDDLLKVELPVSGRELVVIDDGSTDGSTEVLLGHDWPAEVKLLRHERNLGKGAAIRTGLAAARGRWTTIVDADLEYPATNLVSVLEPLVSGSAAVVFGARGFESHSAYNFWYVVGNKAVTLATNVLFNSWLSDIMTCHKAMSTELFRSLELKQRGFAVEAEITAEVLRRGIRVVEVPVRYRARLREEGKKLTAGDGLRVLRALAQCRLRRSLQSQSQPEP